MKLKKEKEVMDKLNRLLNLESYIEDSFDLIPKKLKIKNHIKPIKNELINNDEIKKIQDSIRNPRPFKLIMIGRTGVGKSSLINAIFGDYLAKVSDVEIGTLKSKKYFYKKDGKTVLEVIDTRGTGESEKVKNRSAEEDLKKTVCDFSPDFILFLSKAKERGYIDKDIEQVREIKAILDTPVVVINTQVDELEPSRFKSPEKYPSKKIKNIKSSEAKLKRYFKNKGINPFKVISVSSYIEWGKEEDGEIKYIDYEKIKNVSSKDVKIYFDGRYNIDVLRKLLLKNSELKVKIKLSFLIELDDELDLIIEEIIDKSIIAFTKISKNIGLAPIPGSDIPILNSLYIVMIMTIAYLSGEDLDYNNAKKYTSIFIKEDLNLLLQQGTKLLNILIPGSGSVISSKLATSKIYGIGKAVKGYFFESAKREELLEILKKEEKKFLKDTFKIKGG